MDWIDYLQWPALIVTVLASWMVSVTQRSERATGFWLFLCSNILWAMWGIYAQAYALIVLQGCLAMTNIHGLISHDTWVKRQFIKLKNRNYFHSN